MTALGIAFAAAICFWLIAVGQWAVLRDKTINEPGVFEGARRVRVVAWLVAGIMAWVSAGPWLLPVCGLAVADAISVIGRLWPAHYEREV